MKRTVLFLALAVTFGQLSAQKGSPWKKVGTEKATGLQKIREEAAEGQLYQLNIGEIRQALQSAASRTSGQAGVEIQMPNSNGAMERFLVWENSNFAPELQAQFPEIRAYVGKGVTDPTAVLNFSLSHKGIQTMILRADTGSEFIEPYTKDYSVYIAFNSKTRREGRLPLVCTTEDVALDQELAKGATAAMSNTGVMKTMRLALSCTGEYTAYHGGTVADAVAAMNATMTRCNGVYEKDLAIHLNLIANNNDLVYTNAATDPYSDADNMGSWNDELQDNLDATIGAANYDIGHLFGATGGGGNAGCIGCVCVDASKGSGITSPADGIPEGDNFDIDYVAHEMGHQMGGNHTFSHTENNSVNVEPGSGSTIMGYAGITGATDVQPHSDDYFTYRSILQIQTNMATKTCPVSTTMTTNQTPSVDAGADYTIPKGTAFKLTGSGSDGNGDALVYSWEQNDDATTVSETASYPSGTKTNGPNFRSLPAVSTPVRYMPNFATVLGGSTSNTWEAVSTVARTLNFTLTASDNYPGGGQTNTDAMVVTVSGTAGPFALTSQNTEGISWTQGSSQTITWSVNSSNALTGGENVNILLSTDNGATFTVLVSNTPNDGSETITVPNVAAPYCRLLIESAGNIFYAVNATPFAIGYTVATTCNTYTNSTALSIPDGTGSNTPGATVTNTITIPATEAEGTISDVNVALNVVHTYPNDLVIGVTHPDATEVLVWNRACAGNNNFNITLSDGGAAFTCTAGMTGTYAPSSPLSAFNGKPATGTWTLSATDYWNEDTGSVQSWSLVVCTQVATLATPAFGLADFSIYPNPSSGNFTIQFTPATTNDVSVSVHDIRGRKVFDRKFSNEGMFVQDIQLNQVQSGIYVVTVQEGDKKEVKKIVIE